MTITEQKRPPRKWITVAAALGGVGVAAGAFAAHGLKARSEHAAVLFETAAYYQMVHALALIGSVALFSEVTGAVRLAAWAFLTGVLLFSGSLYCLALTEWRPFAFVTPLGGLCFLAGWIALAWAGWRRM